MSEPQTVVPLKRAIEHLRIDDPTLEVDYLADLLLATEDYVSTYLSRPLSPWIPGAPGSAAPLAVQHAILLILTDLYENRSAQVEKALTANAAVERLLHPHRLGLGI